MRSRKPKFVVLNDLARSTSQTDHKGYIAPEHHGAFRRQAKAIVDQCIAEAGHAADYIAEHDLETLVHGDLAERIMAVEVHSQRQVHHHRGSHHQAGPELNTESIPSKRHNGLPHTHASLDLS